MLAGLLALFVNCIFLNESNRNLTLAASHGRYIMEEIKATDFAQIEPKINNGDWDLNAAQLEGAPYNLTVLSSESVNTNVTQSGNPLGVSVTVQWNDRRQRARSIQLDTLFADYQ